jgi:hypothetical protein
MGSWDGFHTYAGSRASKVKFASVVLITLVQNIIVKFELGIVEMRKKLLIV